MPINFRSKLHQVLLNYYFSHPRAGHYVRELSRKLSFNATYLSRELKGLSSAGLFFSSWRGNEKYYYLNKKYPLYKEFWKVIKYISAKKATNKRRHGQA